jgi:hypothetical protein
MRKLFLLGMLFAATVCNAQVVLWDGEDKEVGSRGGFWDRGNPSVVENPEKDGINTSNKCLKFTMIGDEFGQKHVACPFGVWTQPNLAGNRRLSFMIKKSVNENVLVELSDPTNGAPNYWQKTTAKYDNADKWQKLVFDFSANEGLNDYPGVMTITAQTDEIVSTQNVFIDNIVIENPNNEDVTGITDVRGKRAEAKGVFFDLQGRRVTQPTKGLYIVNGKKVTQY